MRVYTVAIAALAIDAPLKWTDNLLSQHEVANVRSNRRGIARRITHAALMQMALTRDLHVDCGMSVREALELARELLAGDGVTPVERGHLRMGFDHAALQRTLDRRLREALESAPAPRRGRPASRRRLPADE